MIFSANLQVGISAKFFADCQFLVLTSMGMYQASVSLEETFENDKANIKVVFLLMLLKFVSKGLSWMKTALNNSFALSNRNLEIEKEMTITIYSLFLATLLTQHFTPVRDTLSQCVVASN